MSVADPACSSAALSLLSLGSAALFLVAGGVFMVSELVSEYRAARR
jgi:hypothetical protein